MLQAAQKTVLKYKNLAATTTNSMREKPVNNNPGFIKDNRSSGIASVTDNPSFSTALGTVLQCCYRVCIRSQHTHYIMPLINDPDYIHSLYSLRVLESDLIDVETHYLLQAFTNST